MAHPMTLPIMAGLSIVGTALGVHLGRSAIAEINPAYFTDPEVPFHADMVPNRPDWAQVQVKEYQQAGLIEGLGSGCIGCRDYPVEYVPQHDPAVDGYQDGWAASAGYEPVEAMWVEEEPAPDPGRDRVVRYSSYPITAEEEEAQAQAQTAEPEAETEPVAL